MLAETICWAPVPKCSPAPECPAACRQPGSSTLRWRWRAGQVRRGGAARPEASGRQTRAARRDVQDQARFTWRALRSRQRPARPRRPGSPGCGHRTAHAPSCGPGRQPDRPPDVATAGCFLAVNEAPHFLMWRSSSALAKTSASAVSQKRAGQLQDLVGPAQLAHLALQLPDALLLGGGRAGAQALVKFGLADSYSPGTPAPCAPSARQLPGKTSGTSSSWLHVLERRSLLGCRGDSRASRSRPCPCAKPGDSRRAHGSRSRTGHAFRR